MTATDAQKKRMYYFMKLGRALDERLEVLYKQGRLPGAIYSGRGQEATEVGAASALEPGDTLSPTHRDVVAQLPLGMECKYIIAQHFGKESSPTRGRGEATYLGDLSRGIFTPVSMLPDLYPVTAGAALSFKLRGQNRVALAICGEGSTSRGDFHEALNLASVLRLPAVFVVANNQFAYSTPVNREMRTKTVAEKADAYGIPHARVDGNDVLAVHGAVREALERARSGDGPTLIEAVTMRMRGHAGHDSMSYVPQAMLEQWEQRDPITTFERHLTENRLLTEFEKADLEREIRSTIDHAVEFAETSPLPDAEEVYQGVYR